MNSAISGSLYASVIHDASPSPGKRRTTPSAASCGSGAITATKSIGTASAVEAAFSDQEPKLDLERAGAAGLVEAGVDLIADELLGGQQGHERVMTRSGRDISAGVPVDRMAGELMPGTQTGRAEELARSDGALNAASAAPHVTLVELRPSYSGRHRCSPRSRLRVWSTIALAGRETAGVAVSLRRRRCTTGSFRGRCEYRTPYDYSINVSEVAHRC